MLGGAAKLAPIMFDSVEQNPPRLRIALGSDSYRFIRAALSERLAALEAQKDLAASADCVTRRIRPLNGTKKWRTFTIYAITSLTAAQATAQGSGVFRECSPLS